jgi:ABC-type transport system substrate-binding protein
MKKIFTLLMAVLMLTCVMTGCSPKTPAAGSNEESSGDSSAKTDYKVVKVGISGTVETLNPLSIFTTGTWATLPAYYERLAAMEEDMKTITGQLAKGWTQTDDLTYDVEIYDYIHDWNGNPITADDIIYCYEKAIELSLSGHLTSIESIEKIDDYNIRFNLKTNYIMTIENILSAIDIVSQKEYEASSDQMAHECVGTGRYKVIEFVPSSSMKLQRNENYWQTEELTHYRSLGEADEIQIITILEDAQMAVALETGTIDVAKIPVASAQRFVNNDAYDSFTASSTAYYYLLFNGSPDNVFYQNKALRQAVCYAIDVDEIVAGAYDGAAVPMKTLALPTLPGYVDKWQNEEYYDANIEKAQDLLKEAGYEPGEITVRLLVLQNDINKSWATIIQAQLAKIGINVEIDAKDSALWYTQGTTGDYDIVGWNITMTHVGLNFAAGVGSRNYYNKDNAAYTEVLEDENLQELLDACMDPALCNEETLDAAHQYIKEQAYVYALAYPKQYTFARKEIGLAAPGYATNYILVPNTFKYTN